MPAIQGSETMGEGEYRHSYDYGLPAKMVRSGKTHFKSQLLQSDAWEQETYT